MNLYGVLILLWVFSPTSKLFVSEDGRVISCIHAFNSYNNYVVHMYIPPVVSEAAALAAAVATVVSEVAAATHGSECSSSSHGSG